MFIWVPSFTIWSLSELLLLTHVQCVYILWPGWDTHGAMLSSHHSPLFLSSHCFCSLLYYFYWDWTSWSWFSMQWHLLIWFKLDNESVQWRPDLLGPMHTTTLSLYLSRFSMRASAPSNLGIVFQFANSYLSVKYTITQLIFHNCWFYKAKFSTLLG